MLDITVDVGTVFGSDVRTPIAPTREHEGTLWDLSADTAGRLKFVIAHELGHFLGYERNEPGGHSKGPHNIMYQYTDDIANDAMPDCQWCALVANLAR